ncbi:MAG: hypothetical protein HC844_04560 [Tabrizicola sp.]|nr:hypothetical protein [Tabrizicola sp.]
MAEPLTLANSILPLGILLALVAFLPGWFHRRNRLSQRGLAVAVGKTAVVAAVAGAVMLFVLYDRINTGQVAGLLADPLGRTTFFLGRSAWFGLLWLPVLGFVWLIRAQGIERQKALTMGRGGGKTE